MAKRKPTKIERDRMTAQRLAKAEAQPYYNASNRVQGEIDRSMTNTEIDKIYGTGYTIAGGSAAGFAPALSTSSGNVGSLISGIANTLPGGTTDYGVTSLVAGATDEAKSNAILAGLFSESAGIDVGTAAAKGIFGAKGRRDAQDADLRKEQRGYRMQGDTIKNDYLKQLATLLGIRASRENLALAKLQTEAQRLANENAGRGGGGSGGGSGSSGSGNVVGTNTLDPYKGLDAQQIAAAKAVGGLIGTTSTSSGADTQTQESADTSNTNNPTGYVNTGANAGPPSSGYTRTPGYGSTYGPGTPYKTLNDYNRAIQNEKDKQKNFGSKYMGQN